jgi:hypothetical protein
MCQFGYVEVAILNMWLLNGSNEVKFMCCPKPYTLNPKGDGIKIICWSISGIMYLSKCWMLASKSL